MKKVLLLLIFLVVGCFTQAQELKLINEAKALMENDAGSYQAKEKLKSAIKINSNNSEIYYLLAKSYLATNMFRDALLNINKALVIEPDNLEYRWIKVRGNLTSSSTDHNFTEAIAELEYISNNGGSSAKTYTSLGAAESELASYIFRFKKAKKNDSYSDDNSDYIKKQTEYYNAAIGHYNKSKIAYQKALEIDPEKEGNIRFKIKDIETEINKITTVLINLK